ncbi:MAG TPA: thiolase family protein [Candidatus Poseidoniales archaeon]|nr:thiolase family protein [Candidatus Poseidoniales archaeon]
MSEAVIAGYVRSPFTPASKGALAKVRPDELMAQVVHELLERSGADPAGLEDLIIGCAFPEGEQGLNVARIVGFLADLPPSVAGTTVNRFCGSSMQAVHMAAGAIATGAGEAFVCGGVESMSRVPMMGFNPLPHPGLYERAPEVYINMGLTAENLARKYDISREAQEAFALESQQRTVRAAGDGNFDAEIVAIENGGGPVTADGCPRPDSSLEALAGLKPAFDAEGSITAGTSSPLTDGAAAVLVTSADYARRHKLTVMAHIRATAVSGCAPEIMGIGPIEATRKALDRAGLELGQMDLVELNEAFAAQSLAVLDELGLSHASVNLDGGAIALGHPLGASGARITGKAAALLQREGGRYALATMCIGGGQGIATVLEAA